MNKNRLEEEVLLTFHGTNIPFVSKRGDKYFINNSVASNRVIYDGSETEYTDEPQILLDAIKAAAPIKYHDMHKSKPSSKEEYWQDYFNYMYSGKGGLVLWHNPTSAWESELARKGKLECKKCGNKMTMYYKPTCFHCDKPD